MTPRERLAEAIRLSWEQGEDYDTSGEAAGILAADPTLEEAIDFGTAFQEARAALPEGWRVGSLASIPAYGTAGFSAVGWMAHAYPPFLDETMVDGYGTTPALALRALTEALRERP